MVWPLMKTYSAVIVLICLPVLMLGQQSGIQITSPADGAVVTLGQTITISVTADPSISILGVVSDGGLPDAQSGPTSSQFLQAIPATSRPGIYHLRVTGAGPDGGVDSAPVAIDIEPQYYPIAIRAESNIFTFSSVGDQLPIRAIATFYDGSTLNVTRSSRTLFYSDNPQIATVSSTGVVTALSPGQTVVWIKSGIAPNQVNGPVLVKVAQTTPAGALPVITSISPTSGVPGTTQVTVSGSGFGDARGNGTLLLGTSRATTVSSWTDSQIVAAIPSGSRTGFVEVGQNGLYSNDIPITMTVPIIEGITPSRVLPGMQISINGGGFGNQQGTGFIAIGNKQGVVVDWSDTQIVASVPSGTRQGSIYVRQGGVNSNSVFFSRIPPTITNISPTNVLPGMQMTIDGTGFENAQYSGFVGIGSKQAPIVSWTDSEIVATVPAGTRQGYVSVQAGAVTSSGVPFTRIAPTITSISPASVAPGMQMTITGTGFEDAQYTGFVTLGNKQGAGVSWSDTQIVVSVPAGTTAGNVYVQQGAVTSNGVPFTVGGAALVSIAVSPSTANIYLGSTQQFQAFATYSDGTTQEVTAVAVWSSSDTSIATVSNTGGSRGLVSTASTGTVTISATVNGVTGAATLTVEFPPSKILRPRGTLAGGLISVDGEGRHALELAPGTGRVLDKKSASTVDH